MCHDEMIATKDTILCVFLASSFLQVKKKLFHFLKCHRRRLVEDAGNADTENAERKFPFVVILLCCCSCRRFVVCVNLPSSVTQSCIESESFLHFFGFGGLLSTTEMTTCRREDDKDFKFRVTYLCSKILQLKTIVLETMLQKIIFLRSLECLNIFQIIDGIKKILHKLKKSKS